MKKFARKCEKCDTVFNEGYCIENGEKYYCSKECLEEDMTDKEFLELYADGDGDSYWTSWEDEEEYLYYEDGTEVEE